MLDANDLLNIVKKASLDAVNASQPSDFYFGKVTSASPLKILVEQKMTLGAAQLVLTRNVTDFKTNVTVNWSTGNALDTHEHGFSGDIGSGGEDSHTHSLSGNVESVDLTHSHSISGKKELTIHNALQVGDEVILLKQKGGQKYLVLDRVVKI